MNSRIKPDEDYEITDKIKRRMEIVNFMADKEYFKNQEEYIKAHNFIVRDNVPKWFLRDMKKYNEMKEGGNK